MKKDYKEIDFPPFNEEQKIMIDNLSKKTDLEIDTTDISEANGNGSFYYVNNLKDSKNDIKNNFTEYRVAELRKNIDFSEIPEITDFSNAYLRNKK